MKIVFAVAALAASTIVAAAPAAAQPPAQATPAAPCIAVQQAVVTEAGRAPIPVAILSPASGTGLPLIVISHGTGGGPAGHIDTAQALAKGGFVVVAPMHPGDNFQDDSAVGKPEWLANRSRDVSRVIDFMFERWEGHARLAPGKVGVFGMSAGATTALIAAGGTPDLSLVAKHCAAQAEFVCRIMKGRPSPVRLPRYGRMTRGSQLRWSRRLALASPSYRRVSGVSARRSSCGLGARTRLFPTRPTVGW